MSSLAPSSGLQRTTLLMVTAKRHRQVSDGQFQYVKPFQS